MAKELQTATIRAPAFYGINTQESDVTLDANYAKVATNCVLDEGGRLAARKGWRYLTTFLNDQVSVSITSSSTTATVTHTAHGYSTGAIVRVGGVTQTEYNGDYTITVVDADTYTYTFAGSATSPATGAPYVWLHTENQDVNLLGMHRFLDIDGAEYFGAWSEDKFYIREGSQLTEVTYSGSQTIQDGNWEAATLNDAAYLFQIGYEPIYFNPTTGVLNDVTASTNTAAVTITNSGTVATVTHTGHGLTSGTEVTISGANEPEYNGTWSITVTGTNTYTYTMASSPSGNATGTITAAWSKGIPPEANTVLSAYGRLWAANTETNKTTVYWSDVLDGAAWNMGTAGSLDISSILVRGNDEIVALGAHNGNLIIFCTNNIIIMGDSDEAKTYIDPNTLQLVEVINGIGCIARDSVQNIGDDILFLSESGVRSIGRTIQEKSQPLNDLSRNVRDDLLNTMKEEVGYADVKSVYSDHYAFYLLLFPATQSIYCFDSKRFLDTGAARVTKWDNITHTNLLGFDGTLYYTNTDGIAEYYGYVDDDKSYTMQYYTAYFDFGSTNIIKILKSVGTTVLGSTGQTFTVKISTDYENQYSNFPVTLQQGAVYYYNIDEYGIAEYSGGGATQNIKVPVGESGFVAQLGFESTINGSLLTIQQVDLYVKLGRLY